MTLNEKADDMLNRYVMDIARRLPSKNRKEISREIRSTVLDMLEDSYSGRPDMGQAEALEKILIKMGSPAKIARSYLPDSYLIGPMIFPFFKKIWSVIWTVISLILAVRLFMIFSAQFSYELLFEFAGNALNSFIISFGILVFIFFILEKFNAFEEITAEEEKWLPSDLPETESGVVKVGEEIASVVMLIIAVIVFNTYMRNFSLFSMDNGIWKSYLAETNNLIRFIPYLTGVWICEIALRIFTVKYGIKKYFTFWSKTAIASFETVLAAVLIFEHSKSPLISMGEGLPFNSLINILTYIFILAVLIPNTVGAAVNLYRSLKTRNIL